MGFTITYKTVFDLVVWHHHLLDSPTSGVFTPPPSGTTPPDIVQRLLDYDIRQFMGLRLSKESIELVRQKGLVFKPTRKGCLLASRTGYTETNGSLKLTLLLSVTDPQFLYYTNLGPGVDSLRGKVFYLTNKGMLTVDTLSDTVGNTYLGNIHRKSHSSRIVRLPQLAPGTPSSVEVYDVNGSSITPVLTLEAPSGPGQTEYELDCRPLPEGLYRFESANLATEERYLGLEDEGGVFCVVQIYLENLSNGVYDIRIAKS